MDKSDSVAPVYAIVSILGAFIFSMLMMYLIVILGFGSAGFRIGLDSMGYYLIFAFLFMILIAGVFYKYSLEKLMGRFKHMG